jgi:hypothetical protein
LVLPGIIFSLLLTLFFASVSYFSIGIPESAYAADMGGSMDSGSNGDKNNNEGSSNGMPNSATDALTAGGDSDNDDDNINDSGGNGNDNNDGDNESTSNDAPRTTSGNSASKPVCPTGQLSYLFSAFGDVEDLSAKSATWKNENEMKSDRPMMQSLLHRVADGDAHDTEDFATFGQQSTGGSSADPCPSEGDESVSETREHLADGGVKTTNMKKDGTSEITILNLDGGVRNPDGRLVPDAIEQVTKYNAQNKPTRTDSYDRSLTIRSTTTYDPKSGNPVLTTNVAANGLDTIGRTSYVYNAQNRPTEVSHFDSQNNLVDKTINTYTPKGDPRTSITYDGNNIPISRTIYAGGNTPLSVTDYVNGKPTYVTKYDDKGQFVGVFGPDGKPMSSGSSTSTTTPENSVTIPPNTK